MLRLVTIICAAMILTGCSFSAGPSDEIASFEKWPQLDKMIVGYGYGNVKEANEEAWKDARKKLDMSGLAEYYGLAEIQSKYQSSIAAIVFTLVPLKDIESAKHDSNTEKSPENDTPTTE